MRRIRLAALAATAMLLTTASAASAATSYDFSYSYGAGQVITGSFKGQDLGGGLVGDITNVKAFVNGTAFNGPLAAWRHTSPSCNNCYTSTGAVASANFDDNNFFFTDGNPSTNSPPQSNWFYIVPWPDPAGMGTQYFQAPSTYFNYDNNTVNPSGWSLTAAAVPEPSVWAMMISGLALMGVALRRRKTSMAPAGAAPAA